MTVTVFGRYSRPYWADPETRSVRGGFVLLFTAPEGAERTACSCGFAHTGAVLVRGEAKCFDFVEGEGYSEDELAQVPLGQWL